MIRPPELRSGDYVVTRAFDTPEERFDCARQLREQGCKSVRFESEYSFDEDAQVNLRAHGYLRLLNGAETL